MNKVVALLGIIVLITLGGLLFCAGFFTGTTISPTKASQDSLVNDKKSGEKKLSMKDVEDLTDTKSASISEKILSILSTAADSATASISKSTDKKTNKDNLLVESQISIDSLLREIAASHSENDDCSYHKTMAQIHAHKQMPDKKLHLYGKKIVFIGYFKNKVALQIQRLLVSRGYKAHVEQSKSGDANESFVFCGPFKKEKHAKILLEWLLKHEFSEARVISVSKEAVEEILYESISEDSNMPVNVEKDIQELEAASENTSSNQNQTNQNTQANNGQMYNNNQQIYNHNMIQNQSMMNQNLTHNQRMAMQQHQQRQNIMRQQQVANRINLPRGN